MENNYDFYSYGKRMAGEIEETYKKKAKQIEEEYGPDARLEFECGVSMVLGKQAFEAFEALGNNIPEMRNGQYYEGRIDYEPNLRNNSYLGKTGVSHQFDKDGNYNKR